MKQFYIQLDSSNIIRDVIEYPVDGYIPVELPTPLPVGINGGWWEYKDGQLIEHPELKPKTQEEQRIADLENAIMELSMIIGGMM